MMKRAIPGRALVAALILLLQALRILLGEIYVGALSSGFG